MANRSAWLGLLAGAYLAATIALFPAQTAYHWFAAPGFDIAGIEGTIWRGRAAVAAVARLGVYDLEWSLRPLALITGRLTGQVQARLTDGFINTQLSVGLNSIRLSELQGLTSLSTLGRVVPLGDVQGLLSVQLAELVLEDGWPVRAEGQLRIAQLATPLLMPGGPTDLVALGDYLVNLNAGAAPGISGRFEDQGGPLEVAGTFTLSPSRAYDFTGLARARPDAPEEIIQALMFLPNASDGSNRRAFELGGTL